jgi:hypothetical protein
MTRTVGVYTEDNQRVLTVKDEPGALLSTALPPPTPGWTPPTHPFLSAQAHNPFHEHRLRELLDEATSFEDFLARLAEIGYQIVEEEGEL